MHPVKRRRLDQGTAFLNRPFRSPLRKSVTTSSQNEPHTNQDSKPQANANGSHDLPSPRVTVLGDSPDRPEQLPLSVDADKVEPKESQKDYIALSLQLKKLSQSLDVAQQALQIEHSNQHVQLQALISKWKAVAQDAAEKLFTDAKERIDHMGGVAAWRLRTQEDARHWNSLDTGEDHDNVSSRNAGASGDDRKSDEDAADDDTEDNVSPKHSSLPTVLSALMNHIQSFTMDMMLQEMNIDLQVIGYNKDLERWVD